MEISLQPLTAPAAFEDELAAMLDAWFEEAFFAPLLEELPAPPPRPGARIKLPASWGGLGLSRARLPQISVDDRIPFLEFLGTQGVIGELKKMRPDALRPTQADLGIRQLEAVEANPREDHPVLASSDLYILDGHHRWALDRHEHSDELIDVIVLSLPIKELLRISPRFHPGKSAPVERLNAAEDLPLIQALESGDVTYVNGGFSGRLSAPISRYLRSLGAKWSERDASFRIALESVPYQVRGAAAMSRGMAQVAHDRLKERLAQIAAHVAEAPGAGLALGPWTDRLLTDLGRQFQDSLTAAANTHPALDVITVPPDFTPGMIRDVRKNLTDSVDLAIRGFAEEETVRLREMVEANWQAGGRLDELRGLIEQRYGMARRRARFIAAQETSMIASEYARARAQEIGSTRYVWVTRHDKKVRDDHAELDGKVFDWDSPPIVDKKTGRRANPGMDFGCRCGARAVLNLRARRVVA